MRKEYPAAREVRKAINLAFDKTQSEVDEMIEDARYSGTTCTSVLMFGKKLYVASAGDCRAVLVRRAPPPADALPGAAPGQLCTVKQLTQDHTPARASEKQRILKAGGRIDSFRDKHGQAKGPLRIWQQKENAPGLTTTRSFGDTSAHSIGATHKPEITTYTLDITGKKDCFLVLATDGVW